MLVGVAGHALSPGIPHTARQSAIRQRKISSTRCPIGLFRCSVIAGSPI